jgi:hypothetical protein
MTGRIAAVSRAVVPSEQERVTNGAFDLVTSDGRIMVRFSSFDLAGLMCCAL